MKIRLEDKIKVPFASLAPGEVFRIDGWDGKVFIKLSVDGQPGPAASQWNAIHSDNGRLSQIDGSAYVTPCPEAVLVLSKQGL